MVIELIFEISDDEIDVSAVRRAVEDPACGAYVQFDGWVRNLNDGRAVERLEQNGQLDHSRRLDLVCANLLEGSYREATAVYLCCCCWDSTFVTQALEVLEKRAVNLRQIVTIEPLDRKFGLRPAWLTLKLATRVGQTWAPEGYPCYVYEVTR